MKNKTNLLFLFAGLAGGIALTGAILFALMPGLMLREHISPYGLTETVQRIANNAVAKGWVVSSVTSLDESVKKHGGGAVRPVRLVNLCQAQYAAKILNDEQARIVSVMMPCTIAVYEKADGKIAVGAMNAGLLGRIFGGTVAEVMGGPVAREQKQFVDFCEP
jgi:uncharacterized protein (DUF302 family)